MPVNLERIEQRVAEEEESGKVKFSRKLGLYFFNPKEFFYLTKEKEDNFFPAFWFLIPFIIIFSIGYIAVYQLQYSLGDLIDFIFIPFQSFFIFVFISISLFIYLFVIAGILHLILKLFRAKNPFYQSFKGFAYGLVPFIFLSWIPFSIDSGIFSIKIFQIILHYYPLGKVLTNYCLTVKL